MPVSPIDRRNWHQITAIQFDMGTQALHSLPLALLALLTLVAVYTDVSSGRIYNKLTLPCMAAGVALGLINNGVAGMLGSIAGAALVMALFLALGTKSGIGGGDIKMMMAVGALMGVRFAVWAMLFTAVAGAVMAIAVMASHGSLTSTLRKMMTGLYSRLTFRGPVEISGVSRGLKFRYSPAIAVGSFLALWLQPWA